MENTKNLALVTLFFGFAASSVSSFATTPVPNSAVLSLRIFNDCPLSTVSTTNNYPNSIQIHDSNLDCFGFANLHVWSFSADNGATAAEFSNPDEFRFGADLTLGGTGISEGGIRISPWWAPDTDGRFNVNSTGEIAVFGGRLPFYSFTASKGLSYAGGKIRLGIAYKANGLSSTSPATIKYKVIYNGLTYESCELPFDEGNPNEDPPHGLWGILTPSRVGGFLLAHANNLGPANDLTALWENITFTGGTGAANEPPILDCGTPASGTMTPAQAGSNFCFTASAIDACAENVQVDISPTYTCMRRGKDVASCAVNISDDQICIVNSGGVDDIISWTVRATNGENEATKACQIKVVRK